MAGKFKCPECRCPLTWVVQSSVERDGQIVRRRRCRRCDHRWFTIQPPEVVVERERVVYRHKMPTIRRPAD